MSAPRGSRWVAAALALAVGAATLAAEHAGWLDELELVAMDRLQRLRGPLAVDPRIVLCDIDAESVAAYGLWPWSRQRVAALLRSLAEHGAAVVALDVMFAEPSGPSGLSAADRTLVDAVRDTGNVVLGYYFRREAAAGPAAELAANAAFPVARVPPGGFPRVPVRDGVQPNLAPLAAAARAQGFFSNERRRGVVRHYDLVVRYGGRYYPPLALQAVRLLTGAELTLGYDRLGLVPRIELGGRRLATDEGGAMWINFRGPAGSYPRVSARRVLQGGLPPAALAGKLVFVGASEVGIGDLYATPFAAEVPGFEIHAHAADNFLAGDFIRDGAVQYLTSLAALVALCLATAWLVVSVRRHLVGSLAAFGVVLLWPVGCYAAFAARGWHLLLAPPLLAGTVTLLVALRYQVGHVEARARQIRRTFERYVSQAVVEEMLAHPERVRLGGERRQMTVLFSDVSGFTRLSERLDPQAVVALLNGFFTPMTRVVLEAGGTLDKYMGDALMAFFGAPTEQPDHAVRACRAALAMRRELARLNAAWREEGRFPADHPGLKVGIGLNSGAMAVGNMGSESVFDYTVIGDEVNLGSRVEGLTRLYGCAIVVTEATAEAAGDGFLFRELDRVRVKGKEVPVTVLELVGELPTAAADRPFVERFAAARAAYLAQDFETAATRFEALLAAQPDDGPSRLYLERCRRFAAVPPAAGWDGVETLTSK